MNPTILARHHQWHAQISDAIDIPTTAGAGEGYQQLAAFYNSLRFAADANSRFYSWVDARNYSEYTCPQARVEADGSVTITDRGCFRIRTNDQALINALMALMDHRLDLHVEQPDFPRHDNYLQQALAAGAMPFYMAAQNAAEFYALQQLIAAHQTVLEADPAPAPAGAVRGGEAPAGAAREEARKAFEELLGRIKANDAWL